ncbi:Sporulation kinase E [compost metagenome]
MDVASVWGKYVLEREANAIAPTRPFNLLRWFSVISLAIIATVATGLGFISTRFVVSESLERDALLTSQFIQTLAAGELVHHGVPGVQMADLLIMRNAADIPEDIRHRRLRARSEFLEHLARLPDSLLASVYSADKVVVWSTNKGLVGQRITGDEDLDAAFQTGAEITAEYSDVEEGRVEHKLLRPPKRFFIENYIPLHDNDGKVLAVVEIYKEPVDLVERVNRGYRLIWLATALGGALIYLGLYWIVRRASVQLAAQQHQLVANQTYTALGEMSSAVAHSMRNPLASIRTSAELAQQVSSGVVRQSVDDIISQVDRMSTWIRDLLLCLRPLSGDSEPVEPIAVMRETLQGYKQQLEWSNIQAEIVDQSAPSVINHRLLLSQVFNSVLANAIEAMPRGGRLSVSVLPDPTGEWLHLSIDDTGQGMSRQQELMAFKSFYTTKRGGLGIGLYMVKQIMEHFGGKVALTSREDEGTSVRLSFRIARGTAGAAS